MSTKIEHSNCVSKRKLGRFKVSRPLINQEPDIVMQVVFSKMLVVEAKMVFDSDSIEYVAYSDLFDEIDKFEMPPEYQIIVSKDRAIIAKRWDDCEKAHSIS